MANKRPQHCRYCDQDVPNLLRHQWDEHREEMLSFSRAGMNKAREKHFGRPAPGKNDPPPAAVAVANGPSGSTEPEDHELPAADDSGNGNGKKAAAAPAKKAKTVVVSEGKAPNLIGVEAPKTGALLLKVGQIEIYGDPLPLFKSYIIYEELRLKLGLTDSFTQVLYDSIGNTWKQLCAELPDLDSMEVLVNGTGRGTPEEETQRTAGERVAS